MKGLTDKQRHILNYIEDFMNSVGMAPTVYEIADHFKNQNVDCVCASPRIAEEKLPEQKFQGKEYRAAEAEKKAKTSERTPRNSGIR